MALKYLKIPSEVLKIKGLSLPQKAILGMATGFNSDGLKMSNEGIGEIVCLSERQVSRQLSDLVSRDLIRVEKPQSRHRVIRFNYDAHVRVAPNLLGHPCPSGEDSTRTSETVYSDICDTLPRHPCRTEVKKLKKTFSPNSDEFRLTKLLLDLIRGWEPDLPEPDLQEWAVHVDRLIRLDGRTTELVERVIRWSQQDKFWRSNILSTRKLRKQFVSLKAKMGKWRSPEAVAPLERDASGQTPRDRAKKEHTWNGGPA